MKKRTLSLALLLLGTLTFPTIVTADIKKGHRLYTKKMWKKCKFAGSTFARKHTQDEWEKLKNSGTFKTEAQKICPKMNFSKLNDKQWDDLYDFTYAYGIGGEIPGGCNPV